MTPTEFKEWYETLKGLLPTHNHVVYRLTLYGGLVATVMANFAAPEHRQMWMNVGAAIALVGAKLGSSPAQSPDKEQP